MRGTTMKPVPVKNSVFNPSAENWCATFLLCCTTLISALTVHAEPIDKTIEKCGMCHGTDGNSPNSTIPSIAAITPEYFIHTMDAYKNNGRQSDMMKNFVHSLSKDDIDKLATYYAKQTFKPRKQEFDPAKAEQGKKLHYKYCEKCHENGGRITENNYGILAGQWVPYLRQAIKDYLDKKRRVNPMMITKLEKLKKAAGDEGVEQLLHYYASEQ
jgi:sulfide dehydrogenase cytochrome subunit